MQSIWAQTCPIPAREALCRDLETDVAVIGAGMAGVLIAYFLQEAGRQVLVLEADRIASGQTRNTTAKITSQHGMIYRQLTRTLGLAKAAQYAQANETAIQEYRRLAAELNAECELENCPAYLYGQDTAALRAEAEAAKDLGLPASYTQQVPLPFYAAGAVKFTEQAQFHPLKFLRAVAGQLSIYEHTPVRVVEDNVLVAGRYHVRARQVVFACHYPFINFPGMYFARMHQQRSYVLALEHAPRVNGVFLGAGPDGCSLRSYGDLLLFGGQGHRTGENREGGRYYSLLETAKALFPGCRERTRWSAQDCVTPDGVPYIGLFSRSRPNWYVATGFQKWGMTNSMAAAILLRDLMQGKSNPWEEVYDPSRFSAAICSGVLWESGHAAKDLSKNLFHIPASSADDLPSGHGGVVFLNGKKAGVYKAADGTVYAVDVRCPHLGCQLEWNPDERSWDCPCHGSRFDFRGKLISGPAQTDLKRLR